jgi:uncharacterized membrane protein YhaH (DUF805 family)
MDWKDLFSLFFSFEGRINRKPFWLGNLALWGMQIGASLVAIIPFLTFLPLIALIVATVGGLALSVKRLHDRNRSGWWVLLPYTPAVLIALTLIPGFAGVEEAKVPALLVTIFSIAILVIVIWFVIEVGFLKGTQGPNRFGPDPLSPPRGETAPASLSGSSHVG